MIVTMMMRAIYRAVAMSMAKFFNAVETMMTDILAVAMKMTGSGGGATFHSSGRGRSTRHSVPLGRRDSSQHVVEYKFCFLVFILSTLYWNIVSSGVRTEWGRHCIAGQTFQSVKHLQFSVAALPTII